MTSDATSGPAVTGIDAGNWRVLVVDDDAGMRETLTDILAGAGIVAEAASSAGAAEEIVRGGAVALAIVDQRLPDMAGTDLAEKLKTHDPDLPVLILTGYASAETAMAAVGRADD